MSEYQYYEFAAVDRPLGTPDIDTLRGLSTRAHITPTSFVNTYQWGSFKGDPRRLVERYFDAFLYLANWGTRELIMRLPARLVDPESSQRYCSGDAVSAWRTGDHVVVAAVSDDAVEPPVPASLDALTGSQTALADFLRIDRDLIDVAVAGSPPPHDERVDVARWVAGLPGSERDVLLVGLLEGDDPLLRAEALRRAGAGRRDRVGVRTAAELLDQAAALRERREQAERDRRAARAAEAARRTEVVRRQRLAALAAEGDGAWARVAARIAEKKPSGYDVAVDLLVDLREVCDPDVIASRLDALRREHGRKVTFVERLAHAGL